jgi:small subunit ribosomal protein S16
LLRIRLTRRGAKKNPHYRVVVTERSSPRDGRFQEIVGHYNPALEPVQLHLDLERVDHWIEKGAQPTRTVKTLIRRVRAQGQPEEVTVEKVAEKESQVEPEKVAEKESQVEPEKVAEKESQAEPEKVTEKELQAEPEKAVEEKSQAEPEKAVEAKPQEKLEEVTEGTSQEEPEEVKEKVSPDEA